MTITRRQFLKMTLGFGAMGAIGGTSGIVYAHNIEPYDVEITQHEFVLSRLPAQFDGFKLVHISDIHLGYWMTLERLLRHAERINAMQPDAIMVTGDFVTSILPEVPYQISTFLRALESQSGTYAILGNHDHWTNSQVVSNAVRAGGANLLINNNAIIERDGTQLYIAGVDDIWEEQQDLDRALNGIPDQACIVLLAHEPDYADTVAEGRRISLQLSGHSHGGQVRLPIVGAPILPPFAQKYDNGAYTIQNLQLYVNRGLGLSSPGLRFNCSPEITEITLRST